MSLASVTAPRGSTIQLQFFLSSPQTLISGGAVIDLDPAIFDNILAADVYSATGDQIGTANIQGRHLDLEFRSQTGGIGRLPDLPVFTITVPLLATAIPGTVYSLVIKPGTTGWLDIQGNQYYPSITSGTLTVNGALSISSVAIQGGLLPAGSVVEIDGTSFSAATTVKIDGVDIIATRFLSSQRLDVTLAAAADLTFRRVLVQDPSQTPISIFPVLHGTYVQRPASSTIQPIFPLQLYPAANAGSFLIGDDGIALQNPSNLPVSVSITSVSGAQNQVDLPPGASYLQTGTVLEGSHGPSTLSVTPSSPIRMARIGSAAFSTVTPTSIPPTYVLAYLNGKSQTPNQLTWNWTMGTAAPAPILLALTGPSLPFTVSVSTSSGGNWLSVSPLQGISCNGGPPAIINSCPSPGLVTATADPSYLTPGTYTGSLTITPQGLNPVPLVLTD